MASLGFELTHLQPSLRPIRSDAKLTDWSIAPLQPNVICQVKISYNRDLEIRRAPSHPDPLMVGGAVSKKIFFALRASVWSKNKEGPGPGPSPISVFVNPVCPIKKIIVLCKLFAKKVSFEWCICHRYACNRLKS